MLNRTACSGSNIKHSYPAVVRNLFMVILVGAYAISCGDGAHNRSDVKDTEALHLLDQTVQLVNGLVASEHPDPVGFLQSPEHISKHPGLLDLFRKYTSLTFYYDEYRKDYDSALIYADSSLQLFEGSYGTPDLKAYHLLTILHKADVLRKQHLYGTSTQYYLQGLQMMDPEQTPCLAWEYLGPLGSMSYNRRNYPKAIDFYTRGRRASYSCSGYTDFQRHRIDYQYYQNIASNYEELHMPDSALHYNNLSLDVFKNDSANFKNDPGQRHFIEMATGVALGNKAAVSLELGRGDKAEALWRESIAINVKPGFANEHAELMRLRLADYYIDEGRMEEADKELAIARTWLDETRSETGERRWHRARWRWLERMGDAEQAYAAYRRYVELQEAAHENQIELGGIDLAAQIIVSEQQFEIAQLWGDRQIRSIYLISAAIITLMAIAILILIWLSWRESKRNVAKLTGLNKTIARQNHRLEESNQTLSTIMNVVTHDLRSPLVGVTELSAVMLEDEQLTDKQRKRIELMHNTVSRSMRLAKEVLNLDVLRMDSNAIRKEPVEMREFLQQCVSILQLQAKNKNQSIKIEAAEKIMVPLDEDEMFRVISNVIRNAIKFSPEGSAIYLKLEQKNGNIRLLIRDEGIGIPNNLKDSVFDMFTKARRPGTNEERSYGLGLSISKQIVEAHGGAVWFESEEEAGTTFYIELPVWKRQLTRIIHKKV